MKLTQISDFKLGQIIQGFYICSFKSLRYTKNGDPFLDISLSDSTGMIAGKLWDMVDQFQNRFDIGDPVAIKGEITQYNNNLQLTVNHINKATDKRYKKYGYSLDLFIKKIDGSVDDLWDRAVQLIDKLENPYKKLTWEVYKKYENNIKIIPNSLKADYIIQGEFIKNLVLTGEIALVILSHYPSLNKNLSLCGILLCNIGKVKMMDITFPVSYNDIGKLIKHTTLGRDIIRDEAFTLKNFPEDILLQLEHILIYDKKEEIENPVVPSFPEALFVQYVCELSNKMSMI